MHDVDQSTSSQLMNCMHKDYNITVMGHFFIVSDSKFHRFSTYILRHNIL